MDSELPVEVINAHPSEQPDVEQLRELAEQVLASEDARVIHVGIILCGRQLHAGLHKKYLGRDYPTDVLAFALGTNDAVEGEVYVDLDTARERCSEFGSSIEQEVRRYMIHGILHLLGHRDDSAAGRDTMRRLEDTYLRLASEPPGE